MQGVCRRLTVLLVLTPQMGPLAAWMSAGSQEGGGEKGDSEGFCSSPKDHVCFSSAAVCTDKAWMERQTKVAASETLWTGSGAKGAASAWPVVSLLIVILIKPGG